MTNHGPHRVAALRAGRAALVVGLLYAAVSVYWGPGGTALLDTTGGTLESAGRAGSHGVLLALWAAVALRLVAAVLPLLALRRAGTPRRHRLLRVLAWAAAAILTLYGLLLTTVGLLVQSGVIHEAADADHRALAWHAYLWDPWFLVWGPLVTAALILGRAGRDIVPD